MNFQSSIRLEINGDHKNIYDVTLGNVEKIRQIYDSVEISALFYPYSREINSDTFKIFPFEEYVNEISLGKRSAYFRSDDLAKNLFGSFLSLLIVIIFSTLKKEDLYSVESIVSILGSYAIGKELWGDIERFIERTTKDKIVSWSSSRFHYARNQNEEFQTYSEYARMKRYGVERILPIKFDLINHSNSKTVNLFFGKNDLVSMSEDSLRLFSLHFDSGYSDLVKEVGFFATFKIKVEKRRALFRSFEEIAQSLEIMKNNQKLGILDSRSSEFTDNQVSLKRWISVGRVNVNSGVPIAMECKLINQ